MAGLVPVRCARPNLARRLASRGHCLAAVPLTVGRGQAIANLHAACLVDGPMSAALADHRALGGDEPARRMTILDRQGQAIAGVLMRQAFSDRHAGEVASKNGMRRLSCYRLQSAAGLPAAAQIAGRARTRPSIAAKPGLRKPCLRPPSPSARSHPRRHDRAFRVGFQYEVSAHVRRAC